MRLPADATSIIYQTSVARLVTGISGQFYYVTPNLILLDVKAQDASAWLATNEARQPSLQELLTFDAYLSRYP